MGSSVSQQVETIDRAFYQEDIDRLQLKFKNMLQYDFNVLYPDSSEIVLKGTFRFWTGNPHIHWITFNEPRTANTDGGAASGEDVFANVRFSPRKRPISLSLKGEEIVLAAQENFSAQKSYRYKCIGSDDKWYTWSKHNLVWFCFAGDLQAIHDHKPLIRIKVVPCSFKKYLEIEVNSDLMQDRDLILEILVVGIAVVAKDTKTQEQPNGGGGCSVM